MGDHNLVNSMSRQVYIPRNDVNRCRPACHHLKVGTRLSAAVRIWTANVGWRRYLTLASPLSGCPLYLGA